MLLQTAAGHNRGPPQQTYHSGPILFMKKKMKNKGKTPKQTKQNNWKKLHENMTRKTWHNSEPPK